MRGKRLRLDSGPDLLITFILTLHYLLLFHIHKLQLEIIIEILGRIQGDLSLNRSLEVIPCQGHFSTLQFF